MHSVTGFPTQGVLSEVPGRPLKDPLRDPETSQNLSGLLPLLLLPLNLSPIPRRAPAAVRQVDTHVAHNRRVYVGWTTILQEPRRRSLREKREHKHLTTTVPLLDLGSGSAVFFLFSELPVARVCDAPEKCQRSREGVLQGNIVSKGSWESPF